VTERRVQRPYQGEHAPVFLFVSNSTAMSKRLVERPHQEEFGTVFLFVSLERTPFSLAQVQVHGLKSTAMNNR
jgi:hypothetical protein